jgi:haloacetate dehalogenase
MQNMNTPTNPLEVLFPNFKHSTMKVPTGPDGVEIAYSMGGSGPPLLLLHGHPQTRAIWHKVAPQLSKHFTLVASDLQGYGRSGKPVANANHSNYSKRTMAQDQLALMQQLGFEHFGVLAHDRGARLAYRMALDHPDAIKKLMLLDIAPTAAMYSNTNQEFARSYWHWFFLIQPAPLPERLIEANPAAYVKEVMGGRSAGLTPFAPEALQDYIECLSLPGAAHGICADYRAAASIDIEHDLADLAQQNTITCPTRVLWGERGVIHRCFQPLVLWQPWCPQVTGRAMPCGHYIPEECPNDLTHEALEFFLEQ